MRPAEAALWEGRHHSVARLQRLFEYDHLPAHLQAVSAPFTTLAGHLLATIADQPELTEALRKLWEAKNLAVVAVARPENDRLDTTFECVPCRTDGRPRFEVPGDPVGAIAATEHIRQEHSREHNRRGDVRGRSVSWLSDQGLLAPVARQEGSDADPG